MITLGELQERTDSDGSAVFTERQEIKSPHSVSLLWCDQLCEVYHVKKNSTGHSLREMFTTLELTMSTKATLSESQISIFMNPFSLFSHMKASHACLRECSNILHESTRFNGKISISLAFQYSHTRFKNVYE